MKISVITVCYNSEATVEQTIQSVLAQSHTDIEYIVVDGASTDRTLEIINKYKDQISVVISEKDKGIYDAMNKGLARVTGDVVGILNSDDLYKNNEVLSQVSMEFNKPIECLCTDVEIFERMPENVVRFYSCTRWKPWMFRIGHQPPHPGFFVRNSVYKQFGTFKSEFKLAADFEILLRFILKNKCKTNYSNWTSVSMRSGGASQKGLKNIMLANKEVNASLKQNGYFSFPLLIWLKYPIKIFQFLLK
ncbi:MAG: glycosyltransferase [Bacteroidia bacterium]|nr:glycosyltransferase [Bacteroidia bacterium]